MSKTLVNPDADPRDPIIVVGGSYAGAHAARTLAKSLPPTERVILLEQRSHLAHLYVLPRFAVVEGYEEHAFIPYTNIFAGSAEEAKEGRLRRDSNAGGKEAGKTSSGDGESVSIQGSGPDHHPDKQLEDLPKEPRAEYVQSTVTRITTSEVSFVRHHPIKKQQESSGGMNGESAVEREEKGETRRLKSGKKDSTAKKSIWTLNEPVAPVASGSHIHVTVDGASASSSSEETQTQTQKQTQTVELLTPPPSNGNIPRSSTFTCCNDCISPSSGCCQASSSSAVSPLNEGDDGQTRSSSHLHATGPGGLLTPQPSVEFEINPRDRSVVNNINGKALRGRSCATCLSNSETCCQATSAPVSSSSTSTTGTDPNQIEPVAGGMQPPLSSLVESAIVDRDEQEDVTETIRFKYLVYATGSRLPHPLIRLPKKKMEAKDWLKENQKAVREATKVLVVGGGALGIQFASDIKAYFPTHHVILINSRSRFLSIYEPGMHDLIQADLEALGVEVRHNERVDDLADLERQRDEAAWQGGREGKVGRKMVKTKLKSGDVIESDLQIICTGQKHNHELISQEEPTLLSDKGSLNVKSSMQLDHPDWNHVFAIGDVANTSAIKAGHTGWYQAGVAAANIVKMVKDGESAELDDYTPTKPMIKVTVGKNIAVTQMWDEQGTPKVSRAEDLPEDLQASLMWTAMGADTKDMSL